MLQLKGKRDLGIHTEMLGDGILSLLECGAVTNARKNFLPGKTIATFALGSRKLYEYMHLNPALEMHPVDFTNDPWIAAQNDHLVSINGSLEIDFMGQCGSESIGPLPYSGTGGQSDFVRAANRSKGGKSFIVLPSTAKNGSGVAHRAHAHAGLPCHHQQERRQLRRHRVRRGAAAGQIGAAAL